MSGENEERRFLGRWSARKREAEADARQRVSDPEADVPDASEGAVAATGIAPAPAAPAPGESLEAVPPPRPGAAGARAVVPGAAEEGVRADATAVPDGESGPDDPPAPPPLTDLDMPPIESLNASSDLSGFFSSGVSAALRRAALRHVFSQPSYNVRDGLNDYDGDYTVFEPLGETVTSDMKFHAARHERERLRREAEAEAEAEARAAEAPDGETLEGDAPEGEAPARADAREEGTGRDGAEDDEAVPDDASPGTTLSGAASSGAPDPAPPPAGSREHEGTEHG